MSKVFWDSILAFQKAIYPLSIAYAELLGIFQSNMDPFEYGFIVRCPFAVGWDPLAPRHLLRRQLSERPQTLV